MKNTAVFFACLVSFSIHAQVVARLFYDKDWRLTQKDSSTYFRVGVLDTMNFIFAGQVKDFTKNGKQVMTGIYERGLKNGEFVFYYPNGQVESRGQYLEGIRQGTWHYFHANGQAKQDIEYVDVGVRISFVKDSVGNSIIAGGTGLWNAPSDGLKIEGSFIDYLQDGEWKYRRISDDVLFCVQQFEFGKIKSVKLLDGSVKLSKYPGSVKIDLVEEPNKLYVTENFGTSKAVRKEDYPYLRYPFDRQIEAGTFGLNVIYTLVEMSATPTGGMQAFYKEVFGHTRYPAAARRIALEGKVFVEFVIEKDGTLTNFKVVKGLGYGLDEEAIRVVNESQKKVKWFPAYQKAKPVKQRYTLPIYFKLG